MEESGLNVLSDDVMLNIFEYLNSKTMKTATLVCKKWNEIIGTHASTMRKLPLHIDSTGQICNAEFKLTRNYHTIILDNMLYNKEFVEYLKKYCSNTQHLVMKGFFLTGHEFTLMLNSLQLCQILDVQRCCLVGGNYDIVPSTPKLLKRLELATRWEINEILANSGVQFRELVLNLNSNAFTHITILEKLLSNQIYLESLSLIILYCTPLELFKLITDYNFKSYLKKISIMLYVDDWKVKYDYDTNAFRKQYLKLLTKHSSTLKELEINFFIHDDDFAQCFPNLERLIISLNQKYNNIIFHSAADNWNSLKYLEIKNGKMNLSQLKFKNLQTICIQNLGGKLSRDIIGWKEFLINNPSIENASLGRMTLKKQIKNMICKVDDNISQQITKPISVKHLKLIISFKLNQNMLKMILDAYPNMEHLEIIYYGYGLNFMEGISKNVEFSQGILITYQEIKKRI